MVFYISRRIFQPVYRSFHSRPSYFNKNFLKYVASSFLLMLPVSDRCINFKIGGYKKMSENHDKSSSHGKETVDHSSSSHGKETVSPSSSSHSTKPKETFTITKVALWQIFVGVLVVLLAISVFTGGFGGISSITGSIVSDDADEPIQVVLNPPQQPTPAPTPTPVAPSPRVQVDIGDSPFLGNETAPVTIIEFSDFECPFCAKWYTETKSQIDEQYIEAGQVKLVYMHYPLDFHPQAEPAALASECANEQGKFWEFHDLIFENPSTLGTATYKQWASDLSLDQQQFDDCYDSKKYLARVQSDLSKGQNAGIRGTPGFLVNGRLISGAQPFAVFQQAIDAELNS